MDSNRCPAHCHCQQGMSRRGFLSTSGGVLAGTALLGSSRSLWAAVEGGGLEPMEHCGPGRNYTPTLRAAFVRREEDYGMRWPGQVYDGEAARKKYTKALRDTAKQLGVKLELRESPIYSHQQADEWVASAKKDKPDGLVVMMLDRQKHSWPTANKAADSGIKTIIFSPLGTSFTTNTRHTAHKQGCVTYSTNDFGQAAYGMKMLATAARLKKTRCVTLEGNQRREAVLGDTGINLRYLPGKAYVDAFNKVKNTDKVKAIAEYYKKNSRRQWGASDEDIVNGARAYVAACTILQDEQADAITMDCLGVLGPRKTSLPCLGWARLNDEGIPSICERDKGAVVSHILAQYLFDRPGFQQDPVADTKEDAVIGSHCTCATRLNGVDEKPEPFDVMHHHGMRDATLRPIWKKGQRVTSLDVYPGQVEKRPSTLEIAGGTVIDNCDVPPSGGCVVAVKVKFDSDQPVLTFPGFHQVWFYGDYVEHLQEFCQLSGFEAKVV